MSQMDDLMQMVRSVADPDKVDPVCSDGAFVTLTPEELSALAQLVAKKAVESERARVKEENARCYVAR